MKKASYERLKTKGQQGMGEWEEEKVELVRQWVNMRSGWERKRSRGSLNKGKSIKKNWIYGFNDDMSPDYVPYKKKSYTKVYNKVNDATSVYTQPDQKLRGTTHNCNLTAFICGFKLHLL